MAKRVAHGGNDGGTGAPPSNTAPDNSIPSFQPLRWGIDSLYLSYPGQLAEGVGKFVGKAGQLLDAMLAAVGKRRTGAVFIANVIKCRPPGNRNPEPDEIAACAPYLKRQIALASPKLLLAAGKFAAQTLLNRDDTVAAMRASGGQFEGIPVVVTYHPSYLLRSPLEKGKAWDDLMKARAFVA